MTLKLRCSETAITKLSYGLIHSSTLCIATNAEINYPALNGSKHSFASSVMGTG
jgi:hypothetical protein